MEQKWLILNNELLNIAHIQNEKKIKFKFYLNTFHWNKI